MRNDCETLDYVLSLFGEDERGTFIAGYAQDMAPYLAITRVENVSWAQAVQLNFRRIVQHFWSIATLLDRLEWMRARSVIDPELAVRWRFYAAVGDFSRP